MSEQAMTAQLIHLASLVVLNADSDGLCSREKIRHLYAEMWHGENRDRPRSSSPVAHLPWGGRQATRVQQFTSAVKGSRWDTKQARTGHGGAGRRSSRVLKQDLQKLERMGFVERHGDLFIKVIDWSGIARFMELEER